MNYLITEPYDGSRVRVIASGKTPNKPNAPEGVSPPRTMPPAVWEEQ